ncbi:nuclear transport factor 2 family protein [Streptomyces sp. 6N223]|uniref:nuclear transport factor 2 family protein n=1 Tax=Streptomyces sp. 6N223 TaxID=3457412 RepID=UPI003FCFA51C
MTDHDKRDALRGLLDRAEITDLVDRYLRSLDERDAFDEEWARSLATEDVRSETPVGPAQGRSALAQHTQGALAQFARTQHVGANPVIELSGDAATVRLNALMTHIHPDELHERLGERFIVGGVIEGGLARTEEGWRFRRITIRVVWTDGHPPLRPGGIDPGQARGA